MQPVTNKITSIVVISSFISALIFGSRTAYAQYPTVTSLSTVTAREFYVARDMGKPLVTVHMLNGVNSPGVYHVPVDTDLAQLIAYAGGATTSSDLTDIVIRRTNHGRYEITDLDLIKALRTSQDIFQLQDQDIVQIDQKFNVERTSLYAGILASLATVILSIYLVRSLDK